jgi:hypothetical protein
MWLRPDERAILMPAMRFAVVLLGLVIAPAVASASPTFPEELQRVLDMPCKPICTTCHTRMEGGYGTARQPFGLAMQGAGLQAKSPNLIAGAIQKLEASGSDVDKDGTPDVEELRNMENPNAAKTSLECLSETEDDSGCSVAGRSSRRDGSVSSVLGVALAALVAARVRRRRARTYPG